MAKDFSDIRIKYDVVSNYGKPLYRFKVYTDIMEFAKISGHRFVSLVNHKNIFANDLQTLLGFLGRSPFIETDYTIVGKKLEQPIIDFASNYFEMKDIQTYSFEDLENGTDDFHFIRDLEYTNEDGERVTGEIKTFSNKQKVKWHGKIPELALDWWLQVRLEVDIMKARGEQGRVFFYYVDAPLRKAVLAGRKYTLKVKDLYASDYIVKRHRDEYDEYIDEHFGDKSMCTFGHLLDYALERREEMMTLYEDEEGTFYYVEVPLIHDFWYSFDHVKNYIEDIKQYIKIEEEN